jgi:glycosyltransferase involved in cell wall biosynthesis
VKKESFAINGAFLSERLTGIQRYAEEVVRALDKIVERNDKITFSLIVPKSTNLTFKLNNIEVKKIGFGKGMVWEQIWFALFACLHGCKILNFCNTVPLLWPFGVTTIHDISYKANPQFFTNRHGMMSRYWHRLHYWFICKFSKIILTDSEFSKSEIIKYYQVKPDRIMPLPIGWQHFQRVDEDTSALARYGLEKQRYYFAMASVAKNKNFRWILEVAKRNPAMQFAVSGSLNAKRFGEELDLSDLPNVRYLGYVSDGEAKSILRNCKAFLFPSLYEGFGLPPLEALSLGVPVVSTRCASLHEVLGGSAHYIEPFDYEVDLEKLLAEPVTPAEEALSRYGWDKSAEILMNALEKKK